MKNITFIIFFLLFFFIDCQQLFSQKIMVTVVGNISQGFNGDNLPGNATELYGPNDVCEDAAGNIYFVDQGNARIRMLSAKTGIVTTIAGGGTSTADDVVATSESLSAPKYMCIDRSGVLYFTDDNKVRQVNLSSDIITTLAGTDISGFSGDGGYATAAQLSNPTGVCLDTVGNVYIADYGNERIRKVIIATGIISTLAGGGIVPVSSTPVALSYASISAYGIAVNDSGNIYFVNGMSGINEVNFNTGTVYYLHIIGFVGGPLGICLDTGTHIFTTEPSCTCDELSLVTDSANRIAGQGGADGYFGDGANALTEYLNVPIGLYVEQSGSVLIADNNNDRIRKAIQLTHVPTFVYGKGQSIQPCPGFPMAINQVLPMVVIDSGRTETWSVVTGPAHGTLSGFPYSMFSKGTDSMVTPSGLYYTESGTYSGTDSFQIKIANDTLSDTIKIYILPGSLPFPATITAPSGLCIGNGIELFTSIPGGEWKLSNTHSSIAPFTNNLIGVSAGLDTITYYTLPGCPISSTIVLTVLPFPIIPSISGLDSVCLGSSITLSDSVAGGIWTSQYPSYIFIDSFSGVVTGEMYTDSALAINYIVSNGYCSSYATINIKVNTSVAPIEGSNIICLGSATILMDEFSGGNWNLSNNNADITGYSVSNNVYISGLSTGLDTLTYTNTNECGTGSYSVVLNVNPGIDIAPITGSLNICAGSYQTLNDTANGGIGSWSVTNSNAFATGNIIEGEFPGLDTVIYTVNNACNTLSATAIMTVYPSSVTSVSGLSNICIGSTVTLADGISGGSWAISDTNIRGTAFSSDSFVITGHSLGVAFVSYSNINACGVQTAFDTIFIVDTPPSPVIIGTDSVCAGANTTLTGYPLGGVWSTSNGSASVLNYLSSEIVLGVTAGIDTIIYYPISGCPISSNFAVKIDTSPVIAPITGSNTICAGSNTTLSDATPGGIWNISSLYRSYATIVDTTGVITGHSYYETGIGVSYSVSYMNCTSKVVDSIYVNAVAAPITGTDIVCLGSMSTLTESVVGGTWGLTNGNATITSTHSTNIEITGVLTGQDTLNYILANACGTSSVTAILEINPIPVAGTISGTDSVCPGATVLLTGTSGLGHWSVSNNNAIIGAAGRLTGEHTGADTVIYTASNACHTVTATYPIRVLIAPVISSITGTFTLCTGSTGTLSDSVSDGTWRLSNGNASISIAGVITGNIAGKDTAYYSFSNSCGTASTTATINVNLPPTSAISGPVILCSGSEITLSDSVSGGSWSLSNSTAAISGSDSNSAILTASGIGNDTVYYSHTNVCGTATVMAVVTVNAAPAAGIISGPDSICTDATITFTDAAPGGIWSSSNSSATIFASGITTGISTGNDTLVYTVSNACFTTTAEKPIYIEPLANAGIIYGIDSICADITSTFTDLVSGGIWNLTNSNATMTTGGIVTGVSPGNDTLVYTVINSCNSASARLPLIIKSLANAGAISGPDSVCAGSSITFTDTSTGGTWSLTNSDAIISSGGIVRGIITGVDTVVYSVINSCNSARVKQPVTIKPLPNPGIILGVDSLCIGADVTLTETSPGGIWGVKNSALSITSSGVISGIETGLDTVIYIVSNTCNTVTATAIIKVDTLPDPGIISGVAEIYAGNSTTLSESVAGGLWSTTNISISTVSAGIVYGIAAGVDSVAYSISGYCGASLTYFHFTVLSDTSTAVNNVPSGISTFLISPNPASESVSMEVLSPYTEQLQIDIINLAGEHVLTTNAETNNVIMKTIDFPSGIYLILVIGEHVHFEERLIKE